DRRRDDRALGWDHRAHRRALAVMYIRHYRDVFEDERQAGDIVELPLRAVLDWHAARPHLQWGATGLAINVVRFCHRVPLKYGRARGDRTEPHRCEGPAASPEA